MVDRVRLAADTARGGPGRTSVGCPHRLAVAVNGHAVGAAPWPCLYAELCPISDNAIRIRAAVHRLEFIRLDCAAALLSLHAGSLQTGANDDDQCCEPEPRDTGYGHSMLLRDRQIISSSELPCNAETPE